MQSKTSAPATGRPPSATFARRAASRALATCASGTLSVMRMTVPSGIPHAKLMDPSAARDSGARIL